MRSSTTFSVLFWVYTQRADKNNLSNMYVRITVNGKKVNISLKQKVNIASWNSKRQRIKGNSVKARTLNLYLDEVKSEIVQCYRDLKRENKILSAQLVKARFTGENLNTHSLSDIIEYHNDKMAHKLAKKTLCHYRTSQKYILQYLADEYKASDRCLQDLDYAFILGFESFLRTLKPNHYQGKLGNNAVMKHIQRLRKMVTLAYHIEWITKDPFIKFKFIMEKREREFLTDEELNRIENFIPKIERLASVKDLFVFSCYTGISYGDIMKLNKESIINGVDGKPWIMAIRNKTATPFKIPLLAKAELLIEKYNNHPRTLYNGSLLPTISNQRLNSYLKEIADICEIKKNLTFHMARHTFATTVTLSNGVPLETVSKMLGHSKLTTTRIYARVVEQKISNDMNMLKSVLKGKQKME